MIAGSGSSGGFNLGPSDVGARLDAHHIGVSGQGFGLIRACVIRVWYGEMHVRVEAFDAKDPGLEFGLRFLRLLGQNAAEPRTVVRNPVFCLFFKSVVQGLTNCRPRD